MRSIQTFDVLFETLAMLFETLAMSAIRMKTKKHNNTAQNVLYSPKSNLHRFF